MKLDELRSHYRRQIVKLAEKRREVDVMNVAPKVLRDAISL